MNKRPLELHEIQKISLEILKKVASICEEHDFRYFLVYGTLIGAVRHHGFIPWDDDVDIMMPQEDYEKFLHHVKHHKNELCGYEVYNTDTCKEYPYLITRISDKDHVSVFENEKNYGIGAFIDIYPYQGLGNTEKEALRYGMIGDRLSSLCYQATRRKYKVETTKTTIKKIIKVPAFVAAKVIGKDRLQKLIISLSGKYDYDSSNYVGCFVWLSGGIKDIFKREWFDEYALCRFEDCEFRIPKEFDKVLTHGYGDYMCLPPEAERKPHHGYAVYEK